MFTIAIHGGAGTITKGLLTEAEEKEYLNALEQALNEGYTILGNGGTAQDAVLAAVVSLENCPLFNAGKGAVFNHDGEQEMDASIMLGHNLEAGAVAGIRGIKNPVLLANSVMLHSDHVLLIGSGAENFARTQSFSFESPEYFYNELRFQQWQAALKDDRIVLDHTEKKFGTVGAVALDIHGNLAAATSTGGMTNKKYGRVGDTALIGCGTYANNETCAVSCTGHGEYFIRAQVAHEVSSLMKEGGKTLQEACDEVVLHQLVDINGDGGLIATDKEGNLALVFNSEGMYRASRRSKEEINVSIYR